MKKRFVLAVIATAAMALSLVGCGVKVTKHLGAVTPTDTAIKKTKELVALGYCVPLLRVFFLMTLYLLPDGILAFSFARMCEPGRIENRKGCDHSWYCTTIFGVTQALPLLKR